MSKLSDAKVKYTAGLLDRRAKSLRQQRLGDISSSRKEKNVCADKTTKIARHIESAEGFGIRLMRPIRARLYLSSARIQMQVRRA